ncbi:MAG TPA: adenosylcobinamide-phosphate synthase CbiB [Methylibium sp.]|uniref:adenosylcobinamide-phosphate synthase CbiB n=1 Tax=Methylibium sp. TaxID=2067992 RepID=UPI002DBDB8C6|nr:adenosylcobinamide-phosphate synthase CbiB [Methylibium sp.]HEU4459895.1 adenosylcobinamide-phosphate synthase CbiB [Methylibium sp.]
MSAALALAAAWAIDAAFGEPRDAWHPVAWIGRVMGPLGRRLRGLPAAPACVGGALAWSGGAALLAWAGLALERALLAWPAWIAVPALALAIKPGFAWRMLRDEVAAVEAALGEGLPHGRARLARLVSRDTAALDEREVREAAIETLAENLNDAVVAPLCWLLLAGLPGLWVYRWANTLDAMWGYRGAWTWAGKWAARADDAMSWAPARLTAALLWRPGRFGWRALQAEARRTPSPNGGWPMGAMALLLGVRLRKAGVYELHAAGRVAEPADTARALRLAGTAANLACAFAVAGLAARAVA